MLSPRFSVCGLAVAGHFEPGVKRTSHDIDPRRADLSGYGSGGRGREERHEAFGDEGKSWASGREISKSAREDPKFQRAQGKPQNLSTRGFLLREFFLRASGVGAHSLGYKEFQ